MKERLKDAGPFIFAIVMGAVFAYPILYLLIKNPKLLLTAILGIAGMAIVTRLFGGGPPNFPRG